MKDSLNCGVRREIELSNLAEFSVQRISRTCQHCHALPSLCNVFRLKKDGVTTREAPLIGTGFHASIDHLFWSLYLPFPIVKQGKKWRT